MCEERREAMCLLRDSMARHMLGEREQEYTDLKPFSVFVATWNVNGQSPPLLNDPTFDLSQWLNSSDRGGGGGRVESVNHSSSDMYVIGFQELDLSKEAFVFYSSPKEEEWKIVLDRTLKEMYPNEKYLNVKCMRLVGIMLLCYVKEKHAPHIRNVEGCLVGTGIMNKLGNKGGVSIRMDLHNTSMCLVNSHLAAHTSEVERRNQDYRDICARTSFYNNSKYPGSGVTTGGSKSFSSSSPQMSKPTVGIKDHDIVFWLGDLNYRLDVSSNPEMDISRIRSEVSNGNFSSLLHYDQFKHERIKSAIFTSFVEYGIHFPPTYKYDPGTLDTFDSSEKGRVPAWTDRILYRGSHISQNDYKCHMELMISDHKPVSAMFSCEMKVIDEKRYQKLYEDVMKRLDRMENDFLPQVQVSRTDIDFGDIHFLQPRTESLTITNNGQVPVQFEFIAKPNQSQCCKPWLVIDPSTDFLMPGNSCEIELEVYVDKKTTSQLNLGEDKIYEILVLHLIGGKDIFITVNGEYSKSVFGTSIKSDGSSSIGPTIPKQLLMLCEEIESRVSISKEDGIFLRQGLRSEFYFIRDWLDDRTAEGNMAWPQKLDERIKSVSGLSLGEALLLYLDCLQEPVIPYRLYHRCLEVCESRDESHQLMASMATTSSSPDKLHIDVFQYICSFLKHILAVPVAETPSTISGVGGSKPTTFLLDRTVITSLFASLILRDPQHSTRLKDERITEKGHFLSHFL